MNVQTIRSDTKAVLIDLLREAMPEVQVAWTWPGPDVEPECICFGPTEGTAGVRLFGGGNRHQRQEETFTLQLFFRALNPGQSAEEAERRAEYMFTVAKRILASPAHGPSLNGLVPGLLRADLSDSKLGCRTAGDEGYEAVAEMVIEVTHHTPEELD